MLLTAKELGTDSRIMAADFRDMMALVYVPTGSYVGAGPDGLRLGKRPLEMKDGIWVMKEDESLRESHKNVRLSPDLLALEMIR